MPLKEDFSKFLKGLLFGRYHARVRFFDRVAKHRSFCYFTGKWLQHRRSHSNFENSKSIQRNTCGGVSFRYSYWWVVCFGAT